jgi:hypothetical protein
MNRPSRLPNVSNCATKDILASGRQVQVRTFRWFASLAAQRAAGGVAAHGLACQLRAAGRRLPAKALVWQLLTQLVDDAALRLTLRSVVYDLTGRELKKAYKPRWISAPNSPWPTRKAVVDQSVTLRQRFSRV